MRAWQLHTYDYHAAMWLDGVAHRIEPGSLSLVPPNVEMVYDFPGPAEHAYVHFELFAEGQCHQSAPPTPLVVGPCGAAALLRERIRSLAGIFPLEPQQATARLWDVLWTLALLRPGSPTGISAGASTHIASSSAAEPAAPWPEPLRRSVGFIEEHLAMHITAEDVARVAGISHNHLLRLFRRHLGDGIAAYLRQRRMARAGHLLRESTMPIKWIAAEVGIPDLQHFNKLVRSELGAAPSVLRRRAAAQSGW